jgi:D-3-phosphoglycerate dehydrogenase / 2-oxoglutarate reductase
MNISYLEREKTMKKNVSILCQKSEFTWEQLQKLQFTGEVSFIEKDNESSLKELIKLSKNADILAFSPDKISKNASEWLLKILEASPRVKGLALNTVNADYVNSEYCKEREIKVFTVLDRKTEAIAEHFVALLLCMAKRIILNDRRTYSRRYQPELGQELRGKTLGIIGLGPIGERVAELAKGIGMSVIAHNEPITRIEHVIRGSIDEVIYKSDAICINLALNEKTKGIISKERIARFKEGVMVVNLSDRNLVSEKAMAEALKSGRVSQYIFESESIKKSPLEGIETAIMLKPFSGLTREAQERNKYWWVRSIANLAGMHTS